LSLFFLSVIPAGNLLLASLDNQTYRSK